MDKLCKSVSRLILISSVLAGAIFLIVFLINGGEWLSNKFLPRMGTVMWGVLIIDIIFILPFAPFKKTRRFLSVLLINSSYIYCLILWIWAFLITYILWGNYAVWWGLYIVGMGTIPFAVTAAALEGQWLISIQLILLTALIFESRMLGKILKLIG